MTVMKKELLKKAAVLKKWLLRESNCCVEIVTLKKCEEVASPKIKMSKSIQLELQSSDVICLQEVREKFLLILSG